MPNALEGNLKERAYSVIKAKIIRCELRPGGLLSEKELMAEIGSSRTPIREALNKLEQENWIRIYPKRGIFVTNISAKDIGDIYTLRKVNESLAASLAAEVIDRDKLQPYGDYWSKPRNAPNVEEHMAKDREFHLLIAYASGNRYLAQFISRLYDQASRVRFLSLEKHKERIEEIRLEHLAILDRLMARDRKGAGRAMTAHLEPAAETAMRLFHTSAASLAQDPAMQL